MPAITLKKISTKFCLKEIDLEIKEGELLVLLGPTGAGKTTLLNVIAGLVEYEGEVYFGEEKVDLLPPEKRQIGYVFQELYLFPHMDVYHNIAFGLKAKGFSLAEIPGRISRVMELLNIGHLRSRYPRNLSGGEKQRVALARVLAVEPRILLLDEPLSNLDYSLAKLLRLEIKELQRRLSLTTLYVTHNFSEARELADRIAVIVEGELGQVGTPEEIFLRPAAKIQGFIPPPNLLKVDRYEAIGPGLARAHCGKLVLLVPWEGGDSLREIAIMPYDISLSIYPPPAPGINKYKGRIIKTSPGRYTIQCQVEVEGHLLTVEIPCLTAEEQRLEVGSPVWINFNFRKLKTLTPSRENDLWRSF
ncbi:molybdate/tungstate transport system ATP-binding protein [Thermanaeromonas toyohensis ToBE]|uniref:ABC-type quaternary amine transporter n=1 Tax=Thermanaeromonas toyohensis ToBE TaxID=698762 RepID=A0A1W1W237_9FIRM|nr:ABC transporter ATP-binding protein [Thermanaeromonas toyohensis]SMB99689.1 molybdate/tungstate transport system ATP-binding protein [Thermanaeromonas toyohensis ToBE]